MDSIGSKGSGSEEPLVPDEIDEDFLKTLIGKVPEVSQYLLSHNIAKFNLK